VTVIDLDWFKAIDDKFGHPTGDDVLRTFAVTMFANIRSTEKFGRYGEKSFFLSCRVRRSRLLPEPWTGFGPLSPKQAGMRFHRGSM
jgi:hypothetical protein